MSYTAKKPMVAAPFSWRAAVEASLSASELAVHLRSFDAAVQWDAVRCAEAGGLVAMFWFSAAQRVPMMQCQMQALSSCGDSCGCGFAFSF